MVLNPMRCRESELQVSSEHALDKEVVTLEVASMVLLTTATLLSISFSQYDFWSLLSTAMVDGSCSLLTVSGVE